MANDPPFATLNHVAGDLGIPSESALLRIGISAENCQRLEALANQYAGVELTSDQKQLKRKMVSWYSTHCMHRAAR
jgi:hypothetical protein